MFGPYYYHQRTRKAVAVFGSLFNNINVVRNNSSGEIISQIKVPLSYAPKRDFIARIQGMAQGEEAERQIALKLPRMSFEITSMNYDPTRQLPKMNKCITFPANFDGGAQQIYTPVPYNITFQLNVYAKSQDDALQIVEQILPYFTPEYTVTINPFDEFEKKEDTPIVLAGISFSDDYEALLESRRSIIYTLDFEMKVNFYRNVSVSKSIITSADVDLYNLDGDEFFSRVSARSYEESGLAGTLFKEDGGVITNNNFKILNSPNIIESFEILTPPEHGSASVSLTESTKTLTGKIVTTGSWTYTPESDWYGYDNFMIRSNMAGGGSIDTKISVAVLNAERDAFDRTVTLDLTQSESFLDIFVILQSEFESESVSYSIAAGGYPSNGSVVLRDAETGEFRYTPNPGFVGQDSFVYRASPSSGQSETGVVTINVTN